MVRTVQMVKMGQWLQKEVLHQISGSQDAMTKIIKISDPNLAIGWRGWRSLAGEMEEAAVKSSVSIRELTKMTNWAQM